MPLPLDQLPRRAGLLLHPSSLPAAGDSLLRETEALFAWMHQAGLQAWMFLPLHPPGHDHSPYMGRSAFALDPALVRGGDLPLLFEILGIPKLPGLDPLDMHRVTSLFRDNAKAREELSRFRIREQHWLLPWVTFRRIEARHGGPWTGWPPLLRNASPEVIDLLRREDPDAFLAEEIRQFLVFTLWAEVRRQASLHKIELIGDAPLYVAHHSADVWWNAHLFELDECGQPLSSSGVPPDAFSESGQHWGHPLYRWDRQPETFGWWQDRLGLATNLFDRVRIDHFRGLASYWRIPRGAQDASFGSWEPGPGRAFFDALQPALPLSALIAEDLGLIDDEVRTLRDAFRLPGMHILQFAFEGGPDNPHLPQNHRPLGVVFTGTHDNATSLEWWQDLPGEAATVALSAAPGLAADPAGTLMDMALESACALAILPIQDILGLDGSARMNRPGTTTGNWSFRLEAGALRTEDAAALRERIARAGRTTRAG